MCTMANSVNERLTLDFEDGWEQDLRQRCALLLEPLALHEVKIGARVCALAVVTLHSIRTTTDGRNLIEYWQGVNWRITCNV
jgi:hypothetical protein